MTLSRLVVTGMLSASAAASLWGFIALVDFDSRPGEESTAPSTWPRHSSILRRGDGPQLVVFAHPLCSCTAATLEELISLPKIATAVIFSHEGSFSALEQGKSWKLANRIAGAVVRRDDQSVEAKLFRVSTSGTILLYDARGKLLFEGGISAARGHRGANLGLDRLTRALRSGEVSKANSPVFGCGLMRKET